MRKLTAVTDRLVNKNTNEGGNQGSMWSKLCINCDNSFLEQM